MAQVPRLVNVYMAYQFVKRLVQPFEEWEAYKLGIIDKDGKVLRKRNTLTFIKEKEAWGLFEILIANMKKLLNRLPGGQQRIKNIVAALLLLKEGKTLKNTAIMEERLHEYMKKYQKEMMTAGSGDIAGIGVGDQGEPGVTPKMMKKHQKRTQVLSRQQFSFQKQKKKKKDAKLV